MAKRGDSGALAAPMPTIYSGGFMQVDEFQGLAFDSFRRSELLQKVKTAIAECEKKIEKIAESPEPATFQNTVGDLDRALQSVSYWTRLFFNLHSADSDEDLKKQAPEISEITTKFFSSLFFNPKIFARIKDLWSRLTEMQTDEEKSLVRHFYLEFERNGALLASEDQKKLQEIDNSLGQASIKFRQNLLAATNEYKLWLDKEEDLEGLPEDFRSTLKRLAAQQGRSGEWLVTLHPPFYLPFMTYSRRRALREKLYRANSSKCLGGEHDNRALCYEMASLRKQRAALLGYASYAEYALQERMAKSPTSVYDLLNQLLSNSRPVARQELKALMEIAHNEIDGPLEIWDYYYYEELLKNRTLNLSEEEIKPYFECQQTLEGFLNLVSRLYQLDWKKVQNANTYHRDVDLYQIRGKESGKILGYLYVDLFARESKSGGAWMTTYIKQGEPQLGGRPLVSIVCNFTPPSEDTPSLLTFNDALTLFHEGGHAFHELLSQCEYTTLSGTNTYLDFVELPSQFMENWLYEPEVLQPWARHYKTGQPIPAKYLEILKGMKSFLSGIKTLRQLSFGFLDMAWHQKFSEDSPKDILEFEKEVLESTRVFPVVDNTCTSTSFGHLFAGGYAAGYYGYKWAEVLDADAFSAFKEEGLFNPAVGERFRREILEKGGSGDPAELFRTFRGREPSPEPLMKRSGFMEAEL